LGYLFNIWKEQIRVTSEEYQELERSWREGWFIFYFVVLSLSGTRSFILFSF
jgi:hypothetical protein